MLTAEYFIITLTIWIVIASAGLVAGICLNLPPGSLKDIKEKVRSLMIGSTGDNVDVYSPEKSTLMTESTQINRS